MGELKNIRYPLAAVSIWAVFILPSVFFPEWCYLDDPANLWAGATLGQNPGMLMPDGASGRFRAAYYLYFAILHRIFGFHLWGFYLVQSVLFLLTVLIVYRLVEGWSQSRRWSLGAVFLLLTASPVAENAYTLGKAEPMLLFLLMWACSLAFRWRRKGGGAEGGACRGVWALWALLVVVALLFKETAVVAIVFSLSGFLAAWILGKVQGHPDAGSVGKIYLGLSAASLVSILMVRLAGHLLMPPGASSHYTTYAINMDLVFRNLRFYLSQTPDVIVMGLAAGIAGILSVSAAVKSDIQCDVHKTVSSIAFFLTGAAYVAGQLIWRWPFGYYLLIPAAFFSVSGVLFASMAPMASFRKSMIFLGVVFLLTRLYSVPYFVYIARAQTSQDRIFTEIINDYMAAASSGQRLLAVDWPFYAEPVSQANILVRKIYRRQNLQVTGIESCVRDLELTPEVLSLYGVTEIPDTGALTPRAGDFIVLDVGKRPSRWVLRGISPFGGHEIADADSLFKILSGGGQFIFKRVSGDTFGWKGIELYPFGVRLKDYAFGYEMYQVLKSPSHPGPETDGEPETLWQGRPEKEIWRIRN